MAGMNDKTSTPSEVLTSKEEGSVLNADDLKLAEMGYKPELSRGFSMMSAMALGFSITNSWWGSSSTLIFAFGSGGPVLLIYGFMFMALIATCIAVSLGELASAYPNSGGQYYWTARLAPKKYARFLSYSTGYLGWAGAVVVSGSVAVGLAQAVVGMIILANPNIGLQSWQVFVAYQIINFVAFWLNIVEKILPMLNRISLWTSLTSMFVITVAVLAKAQPKQSGKFVFTDFENFSGWSNNVIAFITGFINANYSFSCLDAATHISEEIPHPERNIPKALLTIPVIGVLSSLFYNISMCFSIVDYDSIVGTATGNPTIQLYFEALQNVGGAIFLQVMFLCTGFLCLVSIHTWQSRMMWSFARDKAFPFSSTWAKVNHRLGVPLNAHIACNAIVVLLGVLYIASTTAFNSLVIGVIIFQYLSYSIPIILLLIRGRNTLPRGPFYLGNFGLFCNIVTILWAIFTTVFFCFPAVMPVTAQNMNYISVILVGYFLLAMFWWVVRGRKVFRGPQGLHDDLVVDDFDIPPSGTPTSNDHSN